MLGVRRNGNWLLAAGISLLLSFTQLREEDHFADEAQEVAWSIDEAKQQARTTQQHTDLAEQACQQLFGVKSVALLDDDSALLCIPADLTDTPTHGKTAP
jgi:hypothetical protein